MGARAAIVIVGLIAVAVPALPATAAAKAAAKKPAAGEPQTAVAPPAAGAADQTGTVARRKAKARAKVAPAAAVMNSYADMPEAERFALQSDLAAGKGQDANLGWRLIEDSATGARLGVPEKLVPNASASRTGSRWTSAQGQIQIETFRLTEAALPALFEEEKKAARRQVESSVLKPDSFAISGVQGLKHFLIRAEAKGSEVRGISILYDQATEGIMDRVAVTAASAFTGFPDPSAGRLPGLQRRVEYGTAIIVSARGDLIAPGQLTDECQSITVPGLGHAERVAVDKGNDLALLRLYGARNLVPAALDGGQGGDLTLVGIADPLAQAGDGAATSAAAHLTAQGLDPAPKLGFSGAAATDAQGRFAGMVDLKPPVVVAGGGPAPQGTGLIPVEAIRAFLQAHGVAIAAPAAGQPAPMAQSVLRVICVRK
jgi:hypothetical protein